MLSINVSLPGVDVIKAATAVTTTICCTQYAVRHWQQRKFTRIFLPLDGSAGLKYRCKSDNNIAKDFTAVSYGCKLF